MQNKIENITKSLIPLTVKKLEFNQTTIKNEMMIQIDKI